MSRCPWEPWGSRPGTVRNWPKCLFLLAVRAQEWICDLGFTCVARYTKWPEAFPMGDITAETVARTFVTHWVARFGAPSTITTDRGRQFESRLFHALATQLGTTRIRTRAYHPASNGLVERLHRQLKSSLMTYDGPRWTETLPLVLLGIRTEGGLGLLDGGARVWGHPTNARTIRRTHRTSPRYGPNQLRRQITKIHA